MNWIYHVQRFSSEFDSRHDVCGVSYGNYNHPSVSEGYNFHMERHRLHRIAFAQVFWNGDEIQRKFRVPESLAPSFVRWIKKGKHFSWGTTSSSNVRLFQICELLMENWRRKVTSNHYFKYHHQIQLSKKLCLLDAFSNIGYWLNIGYSMAVLRIFTRIKCWNF